MDAYVLTNTEIIKLRHYIELKYQQPTSRKRASILANAVHRIVESRLPDFPPEVKRQIRSELLLTHSDSLTIQVDDVLQHCLSLDLNKEELLLPLVSWVSKQSEDPLPEEQVRDSIVRAYRQSSSVIRLQAIELEVKQAQRTPPLQRKYILAAMALTAVLLFTMLVFMNRSTDTQVLPPAPMADAHDPVIALTPAPPAPAPADGMPEQLRYTSVDTERLRDYLHRKNSILSEETYMNAIIRAGEEFDVHPLLLFAITGQEQSLVPRSHKTASAIVNNPFNVYGSWERYNTTIDESSKIAAKTVANVSSRRPAEMHPIKWLNETYAEDPNWWTGVTWFFDTMLREVADDTFEWE